jgi:hypothetical protein
MIREGVNGDGAVLVLYGLGGFDVVELDLGGAGYNRVGIKDGVTLARVLSEDGGGVGRVSWLRGNERRRRLIVRVD